MSSLRGFNPVIRHAAIANTGSQDLFAISWNMLQSVSPIRPLKIVIINIYLRV